MQSPMHCTPCMIGFQMLCNFVCCRLAQESTWLLKSNDPEVCHCPESLPAAACTNHFACMQS